MTESGKIIKLFTVKPDGWCAGVMWTDSGSELRFSGVIDPPPFVGMEVELTGDFVPTSYGDQLKIKSSAVNMASGANIISFLKSDYCRGIGPAAAGRIWAAYGKDSIRVCASDPDRVSRECGITLQVAKRLSKACIDQNDALRLLDAAPHLSMAAAREIATYAKQVKDRTIIDTCAASLRSCPYDVLNQVPRSRNISFTAMDKIAMLDTQMAALNPVRLVCCANEALRDLCLNGVSIDDSYGDLANNHSVLFTSGNSYVDLSDNAQWRAFYLYFARLVRTQGCDAALTRKTLLDYAVNLPGRPFARFVIQKINNHTLLCMKNEWKSEVNIADIIRSKTAGHYSHEIGVLTGRHDLKELSYRISVWEAQNNMTLDDGQRHAVCQCLLSPISMLTGGPGYGKTTVLKCVIDLWQGIQKDDKLDSWVHCVAPTGAALKQMRTVIGDKAGLSYETAALLCIWNRHDAKPGIHPELFVCDETSMETTEWANGILTRAENAQVIFIGDRYQLPSIGPSEFMSELIDSKVIPVVTLSQCHRSKNLALTVNAENCFNGMQKPLQYAPGVWEFYPQTDEALIASDVIALYKQHLANGCDTADVTILSALKRGEAGVKNLNGIIQNMVNPENVHNPCMTKTVMTHGEDVYTGRGYPVPDTRYFITDKQATSLRIGDKIVFTNTNPELDTINGEQAVILEYIFSPDDPVSMHNMLVEVIGTKTKKRIPDTAWNQIDLAYAVTIHKAQGSEYDHVIVVVQDRLKHMPGDFACRNLFYTALSRAQQSMQVVGSVIGDGNALTYCSRKRRYHRNCNLGYLLTCPSGELMDKQLELTLGPAGAVQTQFPPLTNTPFDY